MQKHIEKNAWDGKWYRRAYFDDGSPLGSGSNDECQIDSIAQSWSVLSRAAPPERAVVAMRSLDRRLVRRDSAIVQLLDPPFDKSRLDPGYIKGYVPGVRENGGQYTHAAIWAAMAFAEIGEVGRAWELWSMINPVHHGESPDSIARYKVEPYVMAADVYGVSPHNGRGGWTWYTGSAGWMYRLTMESLLGFRIHVNELRFAPCIPENWDSYTMNFRYFDTMYYIRISKVAEASGQTVRLDGNTQSEPVISLTNDHREHWVDVTIPSVTVAETPAVPVS